MPLTMNKTKNLRLLLILVLIFFSTIHEVYPQSSNDSIEIICRKSKIKKNGFPILSSSNLSICFAEEKSDTLIFIIKSLNIDSLGKTEVVFLNFTNKFYSAKIYIGYTQSLKNKFLKIYYFEDVIYIFKKIKNKKYKLKSCIYL